MASLQSDIVSALVPATVAVLIAMTLAACRKNLDVRVARRKLEEIQTKTTLAVVPVDWVTCFDHKLREYDAKLWPLRVIELSYMAREARQFSKKVDDHENGGLRGWSLWQFVSGAWSSWWRRPDESPPATPAT